MSQSVSKAVICDNSFMEFTNMTGEAAPVILNAYLRSTAKAIDEMLQAADAGDADTVRRQAHSIKSSSAQIGALAFSDLAAIAEEKAMHPIEATDLLQHQAYVLENAFDAVRDAVTSRIT